MQPPRLPLWSPSEARPTPHMVGLSGRRAAKQMNCELCHQAIPDKEPIYRPLAYWGTYGNAPSGSICGNCARALRGRKWLPEVACKKCGRPVIFDTAWNGRLPRLKVCGRRCRQAFHSSERRKANRRWAPKPNCHHCGAAFSPKRAGALYCSASCKKKACRRRASFHADENRSGRRSTDAAHQPSPIGLMPSNQP